jgi:hypothetical protein
MLVGLGQPENRSLSAVTNDPPELFSRLDRLGTLLTLARWAAVIGSFSTTLAAAVLAAGLSTTFLSSSSGIVSGGGGLLLATAVAWFVSWKLEDATRPSSRLSTCLRLERGIPSLGERLSRTVGLVSETRASADEGPSHWLHKSLRTAAHADAASAFATVSARSWLWKQPEVFGAVITLSAASLGWIGLACSWTFGTPAWREAVAVQFWDRASPAQPRPESPAGVTPRSVRQETLRLYRQVVELRSIWHSLSQDSVKLGIEKGKLVDHASRARELAPDPDTGSARVLLVLAEGLQQASLIAHTENDPQLVTAVFEDLSEHAEAAADCASAAGTCSHGSRILAAAAQRSAGKSPPELTASERAWRRTFASSVAMLTGSFEANVRLLTQAGSVSRHELPVVDTPRLTADIHQNRLFAASHQLTMLSHDLEQVSALLGMPPLPEKQRESRTAVASQRLESLAASATTSERGTPAAGEPAARPPVPGGPAEPASTETAQAGIEGQTVAAAEPADATAGQPTGGLGLAAAQDARPESAPHGSAAAPVWVPEPVKSHAAGPAALPAQREPAAGADYFRQLLNQNSTSLMRDSAAILSGTLAMALGTAALSATSSEEQHVPLPPPTTSAASAAVSRGISWLVAAQKPDGSWGSQRFQGSVAVTAHGLLALASTGSTGLAGPHAESAQKAVDFLLNTAGPDGLIAGNEAAANGPMYGHAYAMQALAELSGETARPDLGATIRLGCRLLEQTQNDEGGWRYQPRRGDADISVTAAAVVALEAASAAGVAVSEEVIEKAVGYLRKLQNADGGFRYHSLPGPSGSARTAAALVAIALTSPDATEPLASGRAWLRLHPVHANPADGYAAYGLLASSTAAWQEGPHAWVQWYAESASGLLAAQREDGSWPDPSCEEYGTAAAILSLTAANGLLPAWKRGATP